MRVALAVVVIAALAVVGVRAGTRMLERQGTEDERATPEAVAEQWTAATRDQDLEALAALASDRADEDVLRSLHAAVLPVLGDVDVQLGAVTAEEDGRASATLRWRAAPAGVPSESAWAWTSELDLLRARGRWSAAWTPTALHPELRAGWTVEVEETPPARSPVLDRLGRTLSRSGDVVEIGVQPGRLPDEGRLLSTVAGAFPEALDPLSTLLERDDLVDDWYYALVTVSAERADEVWPDLLALPGLLRRDGEAGVGAAAFAPEVVGAVALDDDGDRVGVSGLEAALDDELTGSAVTEVWLVDPDGDRRAELFRFQSDAAPPLVTTLDRDVQRAVEDALVTVDDPVAIVVVDPGTAGVLGIASRPTTGYARGLEGRYPPGAVAGLVPLAAALTLDALDGPVDCPQDAVVGGVRITTRTAPPAEPTVADLLGGGCDVELARLAVDVGDAALRRAVERLGLVEDPGLPLSATGWTWPANDRPAGTASAAVGHARVQTSALGAASLAAAVARGAPAVPVLLADAIDPAPVPFDRQLTTGLREALRRAGAQGPVQHPGVRVAGMVARAGGGAVSGDPAPATGWWVGFLEGDGPDVAIAVVVEQDDGERAATLAQRLVDELLG